MTDRTKKDDNIPVVSTTESDIYDPRIIAIVRFLARRAAEEDFKKAAAGTEKQEKKSKEPKKE